MVTSRSFRIELIVFIENALPFASQSRKVNADSDFAMEMEQLGVECKVG